MTTTILYITETLSRLDSICLGLTQLCENIEYFILGKSTPVPFRSVPFDFVSFSRLRCRSLFFPLPLAISKSHY